MKDIFSLEVAQETLARIDNLHPDTTPDWGSMTSDQMLAHCCVAYDMAYTDKYPMSTGLKKWMLIMFIKKTVVGDKPYPKNGRTAPVFMVKEKKNFEAEKKKLKDYISRAQEDGRSHFEGKMSNSFGALTADEWNNLFYKHLNHHLTQFGV